MKSVSKILSENSNKFEKWNEIINYNLPQLKEKFNSNEIDELNEKTISVFAEIIDLAIEYGNFKDIFDTSKMSLNIFGSQLIIKSEKTKTKYFLGLNENGIYLETYLYNGKNLKKMNDSFWKELFELKKLKGFEYIENSGFSTEIKSKYPELFRRNKNVMFLIFRKYFLSHTEKINIPEIDLGSLYVSYSNKDFRSTLINILISFKSMYKMNYKLWKVTQK